jgi:hypothetical protein
MNKKSDADLKNEGEYIVKNGKNGNDGAAITLKAMEIKPVEGFENHSMFKRAEAVWDNPIELVNNLTEEDCKETVNTGSQQWSKRITMEKKFEEDIEKRTCDVKTILKDTHCEAPAPKIQCEEMLSVSCQRETREFAELKNIDVGTDLCIEAEKKIEFSVMDIKHVKKFELTDIRFPDSFAIFVNDKTIKEAPSTWVKVNCRWEDTSSWSSNIENEDYYRREYRCDTVRACQSGGQYDNRIEQSIDLKPYLQNGKNVIKIKSNNRGYIKINTIESYCNFTETWSRICHE